jgi:hypothetical protein
VAELEVAAVGRVVLHLHDEQGDPIVLVRVHARHTEAGYGAGEEIMGGDAAMTAPPIRSVRRY